MGELWIRWTTPSGCCRRGIGIFVKRRLRRFSAAVLWDISRSFLHVTAGFRHQLSDEICMEMLKYSGDRKNYHHCRFSTSRSPPKWKRLASEQQQRRPPSELDLSLIPTFPIQTTAFKEETRRPETPSMYSEESVTTTTFPDSTAGERFVRVGGETTKLLNLFTWTTPFWLKM